MKTAVTTWDSKQEFKDSIRLWAAKLDVPIEEIHLRKMNTKWASCSTAGRATFNTELLDIDKRLGEYAIVHELLHLRIPNHGKLFKSLLKAYVPDWQERASSLSELISD